MKLDSLRCTNKIPKSPIEKLKFSKKEKKKP
jgi:hypothetical protein